MKQLETCLDEYQDMQQRHLELLGDTNQPDINALQLERKKLFFQLTLALEETLSQVKNQHTDSTKDTMMENWHSRLDSITALDDRIKNEIMILKGDLKSRLIRMKRGKQALSGYKNANCNTINKPHVFSMNR